MPTGPTAACPGGTPLAIVTLAALAHPGVPALFSRAAGQRVLACGAAGLQGSAAGS